VLSKDIVDLLSQSGLPGISDDCIIFSGKIPKAFPAPTNRNPRSFMIRIRNSFGAV